MNHQPIQILEELIESIQTLAELYLKASFAPANTLTGLSLEERNPQTIAKLLPFYGWLYRYYFRVQTDGWEHIPKDGKVLLIGSHNGGLAAPDMLMMVYDWLQRFGTQRLAYALMDSRTWRFLPGLARLATQVGAIQPHADLAIAALRCGASLLIYPGGVKDLFRPYSLRNSIYFCGHRGFIKLALSEEVPIVPFISYGAHSTLLVLADLYPQLHQLHQWGMPWLLGVDPEVFPLYLGLPWGIAFGPLPNIPLPIRLHTRVCPPIIFARYGEEAARDRKYVAQCYEQVVRQMQYELDRLVQEERESHRRDRNSIF
jgi:1-acyl-sn-glycerol-3-phosphate acyltransferase